MAELVAKRAEECSISCDLLAHGGPHPHADEFGVGMVVAEEFVSPAAFPAADRPGGKDPDGSPFNMVEVRRGVQELFTRKMDRRNRPLLERRFKGGGDHLQTIVSRNVEGVVLVAPDKISEQDPLARLAIGEHDNTILDRDGGPTQGRPWRGWATGTSARIEGTGGESNP